MNMLRACLLPVFGFVLATALPAAPGEVSVALEKSPDQAAWSAAATGVLDVTTPQYLRATIVPADGGTPGSSEIVLADTTHAGNAVTVRLESSTDLSGWGPDSTGTHDITGGKKFFRVQTETNFDQFVLVQAGTAGPVTVADDFHINKYEVTKEEWDLVHAWAVQNGYTFFEGSPANPAAGCNLNHPVTRINWYDAVKWCNARSERDGLTPVYYTDNTLGTVYKTGELDLAADTINTSADGYRLPDSNEWRYAALGGNLSNGYTYSGSNTASDVAIYADTSDNAECGTGPQLEGTWPVASKAPNELGIYDMSGNVYEWVWTATGISSRLCWSGGYGDPAAFLVVLNSQFSFSAFVVRDNLGLRLVKNIPAAAPAAASATAVKSSPAQAGKKPLKSK